jgi:diaminopimelate epimerase
MKIKFSKYHGAGNDFILIDNRLKRWEPSREQVAMMCDRRFGIGADGLMLLGEKEGFDFDMTYYNCDGLESTLCGNGGRCITAFARSLGLAGSQAFFHAADGRHEAEFSAESPVPVYRLKMNDTRVEKTFSDGYFINTGSPHFVVFHDRVAELDVVLEGRKLRFDERFAPGGTNVDFAEQREGSIFVRTYERGVENETLSCGTGVTATALVSAHLSPGSPGFRSLETPGGYLSVSFARSGDGFTDIWLEGPAERVFDGEIEIK